MKSYDEIDKLLDLSLNGEASHEDLIKLEKLIENNSSNLDYYLQSIDEQVSLRNALVSIESTHEYIEPKPISSKFPTWLIISLTILMSVLYITFQTVTISSPDQLTVMPRSYGVSLIRQQQEIKNLANVLLMTGDLLRVEEDGELWLKLADHHKVFFNGDSLIKINHHSQESLTLIKGELTSISNSYSKPFIFTTPIAEIRKESGKIKVKVSDKTIVQSHKGLSQITRLKDGAKTELQEGLTTDVEIFNNRELTTQEKISFLPKLKNGIRYTYHELIETKLGSFDSKKEIDRGLTNNLKIKRGEHEGYTRHDHDKHSHIHTSDFHIHFQTLLKINEPGKYSFKLSGSAPTSAQIANQKFHTNFSQAEEKIAIELPAGLHNLTVQTIGVVENDTHGYSMRMMFSKNNGPFQDIPPNQLFYSDSSPLNEIFTSNEIDKNLSAHLPLKGSFLDTITKEEAAPFGEPRFTLDDQYGPVLKLDGKDDYLVHYPVDKLGMNLSYTAAVWLNLEEQPHYDQVIFSNQEDKGGVSSNLVILIRRMYPYLAHLANDTIADEKLSYNTWVHLVFRYHEGKQSIFMNGKLAVSSFNHTILASHNSLIIGRWNNARYLKGKVRDIRIYDTALSTSDISTLYENTK